MKKFFKKAAVSFLAGVVLMGTITLGSQNNKVQVENIKKVRTAALKEYKKELVSNKTVDEYCIIDVTGDKIPELITHGKMYDTNGNIYSYIDKKLNFIFSLEGLATFYPNKHTCMMSAFDDCDI